jgi:hypothetical protein
VIHGDSQESPLPTGFQQMKQVILVILERRLLFGT